MRIDLSKEAAYADKTPYELWQKTEEIPIYTGLAIEDLTTLPLGSWKRKGTMGAFINMFGAGRSCDAYVCEIPAQGQTRPEHYLFEELIYVVKGRGATSVWHVDGRKQTFEWQEGSMFSPPLNTWRQHFNAQGAEPARVLALTDAPVMINRFRNLDFIFNNSFQFSDRFAGEEGYFSGKGKEVQTHRTWDANFIADVPGFRLMDHSARGQGARGILLHLSANTISAHIEEYPVGTYPRAHWHGPGAHILILSGEGYSFMWEQGKPRYPDRLAPRQSVCAAGEMVSPTFQLGKGAGALSGVKTVGLYLSSGGFGQDFGSRGGGRHADRLQRPGSGNPSSVCPGVRKARRRGAFEILRLLAPAKGATCDNHKVRSANSFTHDTAGRSRPGKRRSQL